MIQDTNGDILLKNAKKVHMIGIGGSGMCPIAEILYNNGYTVSGSDNNESDSLKRLKKMNIEIFMGNSADNIRDCDVVVYSAAISEDNPELCEARKKNIPTLERSKVLGALTRNYNNCIGVCGTHGKTTVSSMLTHVFIKNGLDPSAVIGGRLPLTGTNGVCGKSDIFVCESCEYVDTFLQLSPDTAILLNIDNDHLEYFKTMENLVKSFCKFVSMAKTVFVNGDDKLSMTAVCDIPSKVYTFGLNKSNDFYADNLTVGEKGYSFDFCKGGEMLCNISLSVPGKHNVYNALAVCAVAYENKIKPENIADAIYTFYGAGRRFEVLGTAKGATLVDDFAHHPTEIIATLTAARTHCKGKLTVVFQPYTYSRTALLLEDFAKALSLADKVILTPIMAAREKNEWGISSEKLAELLPNCVCVKDFFGARDEVFACTCADDTVITMGGGDIYKAAYLMKDEE